jgi:hypothetical protein
MLVQEYWYIETGIREVLVEKEIILSEVEGGAELGRILLVE